MTNGSSTKKKPKVAFVSLCSGHFWQGGSVSLHDFQSEGRLTYSSKGRSRQARLRTNRTAKHKKATKVEDLERFTVVVSVRGHDCDHCSWRQARSRLNQEPRRPAPDQVPESNESLPLDVFSTPKPSRTMSGGLSLIFFYFLWLTIISASLRFGSALCPVAEEALGRQKVFMSETSGRAGLSNDFKAQIHHRHQSVQLRNRSSGDFLGAHGAQQLSCLQERSI